MKFYKPEDFETCFEGQSYTSYGFALGNKETSIKSFKALTSEQAADQANAKLEREGKVVYGTNGIAGWSEIFRGTVRIGIKDSFEKPSHKALLINIEPVEKCTHPAEKIKVSFQRNATDEFSLNSSSYQCECGAKVKPKEFEVVE